MPSRAPWRPSGKDERAERSTPLGAGVSRLEPARIVSESIGRINAQGKDYRAIRLLS